MSAELLKGAVECDGDQVEDIGYEGVVRHGEDWGEVCLGDDGVDGGLSIADVDSKECRLLILLSRCRIDSDCSERRLYLEMNWSCALLELPLATCVHQLYTLSELFEVLRPDIANLGMATCIVIVVGGIVRKVASTSDI